MAGVSPDISVAGCAPMSANRFTVACCMAVSVLPPSRQPPLSRPHDHCTVPAPNTRAPLGGAVQGQVVGGGAVRLGRAAVVGEDLRAGAGRRRQVHQPGGPEPVVGVDVPLVAEGADALIERDGLAGRQAGHPGVAPEPELAVLRRHGDVGGAGVDVEQLPGQRVLRVARRPPAG